MKPLHLTALLPAELCEFVAALGEPPFRARQIFAGIHHRRLRSLDEMTDLPKELRAKLGERTVVSTLGLESRFLSTDGTRRYLFKTHDNLPVETVFIPEEHRDTICFSSQSGCPLQCTFCLTAQLGLLRNLTAGEIVEQIAIALNDAYGVGVRTPRGTNLVGMGAGEPFLNFEALMKAIPSMSVNVAAATAQAGCETDSADVLPHQSLRSALDLSAWFDCRRAAEIALISLSRWRRRPMNCATS